MSGTITPYGYQYEAVAVSQTAQVMGGVGAIGDYVHRLIISVATAATSTVAILDGVTSYPVCAANTAIGVYSFEMNMLSTTGPWKITTGAGATVIAVGIFSA